MKPFSANNISDLKLEKVVEVYATKKLFLGRATEITDINYEEMNEELSKGGIEIRRDLELVEEFAYYLKNWRGQFGEAIYLQNIGS